MNTITETKNKPLDRSEIPTVTILDGRGDPHELPVYRKRVGGVSYVLIPVQREANGLWGCVAQDHAGYYHTPADGEYLNKLLPGDVEEGRKALKALGYILDEEG